jgi:hypothetical protein
VALNTRSIKPVPGMIKANGSLIQGNIGISVAAIDAVLYRRQRRAVGAWRGVDRRLDTGVGVGEAERVTGLMGNSVGSNIHILGIWPKCHGRRAGGGFMRFYGGKPPKALPKLLPFRT